MAASIDDDSLPEDWLCDSEGFMVVLLVSDLPIAGIKFALYLWVSCQLAFFPFIRGAIEQTITAMECLLSFHLYSNIEKMGCKTRKVNFGKTQD